MEKAICHKESNVLLKIHASMFHLLIKDKRDYFNVDGVRNMFELGHTIEIGIR